MRLWLVLAAIGGWWLGAPTAIADSAALESLYGRWQGVEVEAEGLQGLEPQDLNVAISPEGAGFRIRWTALAARDGAPVRREIEVGFEPTGKPGVFAYREEPGSLFGRLFAAPATGNPLEGETLLWARIEGPSLVVYSLALDRSGGFDLDRYQRTRHEQGLTLTRTRQTRDGRTITVQGRLEPAKG